MRRPSLSRVGACLCFGLLSMVFQATAFAQSSTHYSMKRVGTSAGAVAMTSTNYSNRASVGQESPVGSASFCNVGSRTSTGFWSVLGVGAVPIVLTGRRNASDPLDVDLSWSGADPIYQVYRAFTPADIFNPANLEGETSSCSTTDMLAFQSNLIYYSVIRRP